jgi:hypothetical protein
MATRRGTDSPRSELIQAVAVLLALTLLAILSRLPGV